MYTGLANLGLNSSGNSFSPASLFTASEQGYWYDSSDLNSMYQDSTGITPATAPGQGVADCPIGMRKDKSGRGNHATQSAAASRPTLSARYNLLTATAALSTQSATVLAASHVLSFTGTGTVTLSGTSTAGPLVGTGANNRVSLTFAPTAGSLTLTVSGSVTLADLRLADDAAKAIPAYQAVTSATTYDTAGFPWYLATDGVDDGMVTNTIDFTGTDKMTVWAGVTKLSDAAQGVLLEHGTSSANIGTFTLLAPANTAVPRFGWYARSTTGSTATTGADPSGFAAPFSGVVTGTIDFAQAAGAELVQRVNGVPSAQSVNQTQENTGTCGNQVMYLYRRNAATSPAAVRDYGQIVRGAASTAAQISQTEKYLAIKMGVAI